MPISTIQSFVESVSICMNYSKNTLKSKSELHKSHIEYPKVDFSGKTQTKTYRPRGLVTSCELD